MAFKLSFDQAKMDAIETESRESEAKLMGNNITVNFLLPDGEKATAPFRTSNVVEKLKLYIQDKHDLPYDQQEMFFNGKRMPDPLSLRDFVSDTTDSVEIEVRITEDDDDDDENVDDENDNEEEEEADGDADEEEKEED